MLRYFKTQSGKKLVFYLAGSTTFGLFLANYLPNTLGLEYYKNFYQCYRNGSPQLLSSKLVERLNEASNILEIDPTEKQLIKPFSAYGFELFSAGSTKTKYGCILGIPFNYELDESQNIESLDICYRGQKINWNTESGKLLQEAMVLSEDEQIFGFCKTLLQLQTNYVIVNSIYPSLSFLMVYSVGRYLNQSLKLLQKPLSVRVVMYSILGLFGFGTWSFMKDYNQVSYDIEIDKKLASIDPKYITAGIGFYDKQLKKNIALRALGNDNSFTTTGNINYTLRQKALPLTVRKSFFESEKNKLNS